MGGKAGDNFIAAIVIVVIKGKTKGRIACLGHVVEPWP